MDKHSGEKMCSSCAGEVLALDLGLLMGDTVHIPQGREEANANELSNGEGPDPISGFPNLKSLRCRLKKI